MKVGVLIDTEMWLSPNPFAKGNNRHVLRPYTDGGRRAIAEAHKPHRTKLRPSEMKLGVNSHRDVGGSIPPSLITAAPMYSLEQNYWRACRESGRNPHPAIMPAAVAEFGIKLATDEYDTVADFMAGSCTTAAVADSLNRYAIAADRSRKYLESGAIRYRSMDIPIQEIS